MAYGLLASILRMPSAGGRCCCEGRGGIFRGAGVVEATPPPLYVEFDVDWEVRGGDTLVVETRGCCCATCALGGPCEEEGTGFEVDEICGRFRLAEGGFCRSRVSEVAIASGVEYALINGRSLRVGSSLTFGWHSGGKAGGGIAEVDALGT